MGIINKILFLLIFFLPASIESQEIDPALIAQLTPEQLELLVSSYDIPGMSEGETTTKEIIESVAKTPSSVDNNSLAGMKYGYDFFKTMATSISAVGDLPLPNDNRIALNDQLTIILSGSKDAIFDLTVKLDGTILFPELGSVSVVGKTFSEVKDKLYELISVSYIGVNIDVSLKDLSAKKITIVGAVNTPGTYLVNPFSTITNALAYSGGVSEIGTLRNIKLLRSNGEVYKYDLYDLLIKGDRSNDITIQAGDTILIEAAKQFIELKGAVKRPGIYEVIPEDDLESLIEYGLGFALDANTSKLELIKIVDDFANFIKFETSDLGLSLSNMVSVQVYPFSSKYEDNVTLTGAVYEPGLYSSEDYEDLSELINNISFANVYPWLAFLERFDDENLKKESILFNLNDPSTYDSVSLDGRVRVHFLAIDDLDYSLADNQTQRKINDFSLTINYQDEIYKLPVYGRFKPQSLVEFLGLDLQYSDLKAIYIQPTEDYITSQRLSDMSFVAQRYNLLQIRNPINNLIQVDVGGQVNFPGKYFLKSGSTIEELYTVIGGFKDQALLDGAILQRKSVKNQQIQSYERSYNEAKRIILSNPEFAEDIGSFPEEIDETNLGRVAGNFSPGSPDSLNFILRDGDTIFIPEVTNVVSVVGEVLNPTAFLIDKRLSGPKAVEKAGGFRETANKSGLYVIAIDGSIRKLSRNFFTGNNSLEPGDTLVVPRRYYRRGIGELMPLTQVLSDLAFSAAALESLKNN